MKVEKIKDELESLKVELKAVKVMTEDRVMELYNADCKADIVEILEEEIKSMQGVLDEALVESELDSYSTDRLDPAFSSWEQVNAMFV